MAKNGARLGERSVGALISWPYDGKPLEVAGTDHLHWVINAFVRYDEATDRMIDMITVEVEAPTEALAIARAQRIVPRPLYRVASVRETCSLDRDLREARA